MDEFPVERQLLKAPVNWCRGELIGAGAFGRVYLGLNSDNGELMAVKQVVSAKTSPVLELLQHKDSKRSRQQVLS